MNIFTAEIEAAGEQVTGFTADADGTVIHRGTPIVAVREDEDGMLSLWTGLFAIDFARGIDAATAITVGQCVANSLAEITPAEWENVARHAELVARGAENGTATTPFACYPEPYCNAAHGWMLHYGIAKEYA